MSTKLTSEEIKLRGSLLAKNKELLKLHKELVSSNVLSEEEFWEDRKRLLRTQKIVLKQRRGASSALVADDLKPANNSTTSDVKYVLTPTIIHTIFEQHPILNKAFSELVKSESPKLTEREFWIEYFKSKFFNDSKSVQTGSNVLDHFYQEESVTEEKSIEESNVKVSNQCDISRTDDDHVVDYLHTDSSKSSSWNSIRQFNKHSLRVLQAQKTLEEDHRDFDIEISDLKVQTNPELAILNVKESQLFSSSSAEGLQEARMNFSKDDLIEILKKIDSSSFDASKFQFNYSKGKEIISALLERNNFQKHSLEPSGNKPSISVSDLPEDQIQIINSCTEILRHFWKIASGTGKLSQEKLGKLTRFISVLERMEERIQFIGSGNLIYCIKRAKSKYKELNK